MSPQVDQSLVFPAVSPTADIAWTPVPDDLAELADASGVATSFWDQAGELVQVSAETVISVLAAMGIDGRTPESVATALHEIRMRDWRRSLPPVFVGRQDQDRRLWVHVPHGSPVRAWVELESGGTRDLQQTDWWVEPVDVDGVLKGEASFVVPGDLPMGYHVIHCSGAEGDASTPLIMAPARLTTSSRIGDRQWGLMTQLYSVRSRESWGLGDLGDLRDLTEWSAGLGAGFVLVNPLHAASPVPPMAPSPYLPVTRRFVNPIYIRVDDVPELASVPADVRREITSSAQELRSRNATADLLDRDAVWAAKRRALYAVFQAGRSADREREFAAFVERQGQGLIDFATWSAIADARESMIGWPDDLAHPRSLAVEEFRSSQDQLVRFHMWLQWIVDGQLASVQRAGREAGMAIGVMLDLAVGVHPEGADAWALQDVLAGGVGVGAPPDMYNQMGQNWHQPPWRPEALAEAAFVPYRDMLRTVMGNAGALRIDHVLGLFRMWWVPAGFPASAGTFVRFDHDAMLAILTLEAERAGVVVVGEDLGTVEPWVQQELLDRGILGTSILWFEYWDSGAIKDPFDWRREVLASVSVHDLPPTAGYLRNEHVRIRADLNLLTVPTEVELDKALRERDGWARLLQGHGWLAEGLDPASDAGLDEFVVALHRAVAASPARLVGVALPDLVGDRRAQNQPGTDQEYPNWRVPLTDGNGDPVLLDEVITGSALSDRILGAVTDPRPLG